MCRRVRHGAATTITTIVITTTKTHDGPRQISTPWPSPANLYPMTLPGKFVPHDLFRGWNHGWADRRVRLWCGRRFLIKVDVFPQTSFFCFGRHNSEIKRVFGGRLEIIFSARNYKPESWGVTLLFDYRLLNILIYLCAQ